MRSYILYCNGEDCIVIERGDYERVKRGCSRCVVGVIPSFFYGIKEGMFVVSLWT
jgi:hypothetical protein